MKIYNLTDVKTSLLEQRGLVEQHIAIGDRMVAPGEFVEVEDTPLERKKLKALLAAVAVAIDSPPEPYVRARAAKQASSGSQLSRTVSHVNVNETKVAREPAPNPTPPVGERASLERYDAKNEASDEVDEKGGKKSRK